MRRSSIGFLAVVAVCCASVARAEPPAASTPSVAVARRLGDAFVKVAEQVSPSVVQIDVTVDGREPSQWSSGGLVQRGMGSGVILSADGAILTNNHVIEGARAINVRLHDGRILEAKLAGRDPATDLAVLVVQAKGLPAAKFGNSDRARVGEWVLAIGSPFGLGYTVTTGVLSAKGRGGVGVNAVEDYLQTDASINPGNSGGPLVNLDGEVLGINTMIVSRGQGIGLAVPAALALKVASDLRTKGQVERAWIGVGIQDLTPQLAAEMPGAPSAGAVINAINANGPASQSNLRPGDIVVAIEGESVVDAQSLLRSIFARSVGDKITFEVIRGGKRYQANVTLGKRNEPAPPPLPMQRTTGQSGLGVQLRDVSVPRPEQGQRASVAQVFGVAAGSAADRAGVRPGDVVLEADGIDRPDAAQVAAAAQDGRLLCRLQRGAATFYTAIRK